MVCQNQSIDDSDADLAHDLRVLVRERLTAGDSDEEVIDYVVSRYGEFVLLKPRFSLRNALLWGTPVLLLVGGGVFIAFGRPRRRAATAAAERQTRSAALEAFCGGNELRRRSYFRTVARLAGWGVVRPCDGRRTGSIASPPPPGSLRSRPSPQGRSIAAPRPLLATLPKFHSAEMAS